MCLAIYAVPLATVHAIILSLFHLGASFFMSSESLQPQRSVSNGSTVSALIPSSSPQVRLWNSVCWSCSCKETACDYISVPLSLQFYTLPFPFPCTTYIHYTCMYTYTCTCTSVHCRINIVMSHWNKVVRAFIDLQNYGICFTYMYMYLYHTHKTV